MENDTSHVISRIDRLEGKIDTLTEAITTMARIEERLAYQSDGLHRLGNYIDRLEGRVISLETSYWKLAGAVGVVTALAMLVGNELVGRLL